MNPIRGETSQFLNLLNAIMLSQQKAATQLNVAMLRKV